MPDSDKGVKRKCDSSITSGGHKKPREMSSPEEVLPKRAETDLPSQAPPCLEALILNKAAIKDFKMFFEEILEEGLVDITDWIDEDSAAAGALKAMLGYSLWSDKVAVDSDDSDGEL